MSHTVPKKKKKEKYSFKVFDGLSSKCTHKIPHGPKKLHYRGLVLHIVSNQSLHTRSMGHMVMVTYIKVVFEEA